MQPISITIGHFRALRNCSLDLADNTVLVGQNGAGKSTVLQALRYFFDVGTSASPNDQHYGSEDPLSVTLTFAQLNERELITYANFLDKNHLVVSKIGLPGEIPRYTARGRKYPGFDPIRDFENQPASAFNTAYKQFADAHPDYALARPRAAADCKAELRRWEEANPERLVEAEVEFTFEGSTKSQLIPTTGVIYVPAVHRAADDFKAPRSPLGQMIDALVMGKVQNEPRIQETEERWDDEYQKIFASAGAQELSDLATTLSTALSDFVPGATVTLGWQEAHPTVPMPQVWSKVSEDGVPTDIDQQGHGLQRAMIMALLQARDEHLRARRSGDAAEASDARVTHVLLLIEEPELYQHPPRARHFRRLLNKLATDTASDSRFRIVASTHSANFVSLDDLESIRIVRKDPLVGGVPVRSIAAVTVKGIAETMSAHVGRAYSEADVRKNLHVLDAPLREAFFASAIVLTEGSSDVGVLTAVSEHVKIDLEARDVVMAAMAGKGLLPLAIVILSMLGIRKYVVFDGDEEAQLTENQRLLRVLGAAAGDIPAAGSPPTTIRDSYAMLHTDMESVLKADFGEVAYNECVTEAGALFGKQGDAVMKNPVAARHVVELLLARGLRSETIEAIVTRLSTL